MELQPIDVVAAMLEPHDHVLHRARTHAQLRRLQALFFNYQRVVARGAQRRGHAVEQAAAFVTDDRAFAMSRGRAHDRAAERGRDGLMAKADPQDGDLAAQLPHELHRRPGVLGPARPGRDHNAPRPRGQHVLDCDLVGSHHKQGRTKRPQRLHDVVREGIVIIHDQQLAVHGRAPGCGAPSAANTAPALAWHSASSSSGIESATMPAPARTPKTPSRANALRSVIQASSEPSKPKYATLPPYGPRCTPSNAPMSCIARIFGAPLTVPAGNAAAKRSNASQSARSRPCTSEARCST